MQVAEVMNSPVLCTPATGARKAASLMRQYDVGVLVIVKDLANRKLAGIITDRDLVLRLLTDRDPDKTTVQECMTHGDILRCKPEDDVAQVLEAMANRRVRRVPVVSEGDRVEGVLTDRGVLQYAEIDPIKLCTAMARVIASKTRMPDSLDSGTSFP